MDKFILCLANSYKHGGRCIAGIEFELNNSRLRILKSDCGIPVWIRPVSQSVSGEVPINDAIGINVLSLIKIHDVTYAGNCSHSEDYYYKKLEVIQSLNLSDALLRACTDTLHTKIFGNKGKALTPDSFNSGNYSLMFIKTEGSRIYIDERFEKPKARIIFTHCGNEYDFPITDPEYLDKLHRDHSLYRNYDILYIVISLGVEHDGWHSKLATTIILPPTYKKEESIAKGMMDQQVTTPIIPNPNQVHPTIVQSKTTQLYTSSPPDMSMIDISKISNYTIPESVYNLLKSTNTSSSFNSNRGGCYVATAVYGSYDCTEVWTLRRYRDYKLAKHFAGRLFIKVYYTTSPILVKWLGKALWFQLITKPILDLFVKRLLKKGIKATPYIDEEC